MKKVSFVVVGAGGGELIDYLLGRETVYEAPELVDLRGREDAVAVCVGDRLHAHRRGQ